MILLDALVKHLPIESLVILCMILLNGQTVTGTWGSITFSYPYARRMEVRKEIFGLRVDDSD